MMLKRIFRQFLDVALDLFETRLRGCFPPNLTKISEQPFSRTPTWLLVKIY